MTQALGSETEVAGAAMAGSAPGSVIRMIAVAARIAMRENKVRVCETLMELLYLIRTIRKMNRFGGSDWTLIGEVNRIANAKAAGPGWGAVDSEGIAE